MEFRTASTITPTSAKIAIHILAIPIAPRSRHTSFTPIENHMFSFTIRRHFTDIFIAFDIFMGSSSIRTISAASIAASDPIAPIAMPISALERTGASFMPSPTKASAPPFSFCTINSSVFATLSAGRSSL